MGKLLLPLLAALLLVSALALHKQQTPAGLTELQALRDQQKLFETKVNGLVQNITEIEKQINATTNNSQKVILL